MPTIVPGYNDFIRERMKLMAEAKDPNLKAHFKAEIDLVKSWGVADIADDDPGPSGAGDIGNAGDMQGNGGNANNNPSTPPPIGGHTQNKPGQNNPGVNGQGGGNGGGTYSPDIISRYATELPPNLPAVFDLPVDGGSKTLRQVIVEAAQKTGTPAIILAGQAWQETKAGLWGKDAQFVAKYGKVGSGAGSGASLDQVTVTTTNPGSGVHGDVGILQVNETTFATVTNGGDMGYGVKHKPHPELKGLDRTKVADSFIIAGTLMKDYFDHYRKQSYAKSDADAWDYALRAYVGGPGAVVPGDPHARAAGGGDITYVSKVHDHMSDFVAGVNPRWPA